MYSFFPWLKDYNGLAFDCLPVTTCIAIALGLDYDIFLVTRVLELRLEGKSDREAIVQGVALTGSIISGAGLIMWALLFWMSESIHNKHACAGGV